MRLDGGRPGLPGTARSLIAGVGRERQHCKPEGQQCENAAAARDMHGPAALRSKAFDMV